MERSEIVININDIKNGMTILFEDNIYVVLDFQHVKPGKGAAFVQAKLKNLRTGSIIEKRFNSGVKVEKAMIEKKNMQYLYESGGVYTFMDNQTYEQLELSEEHLGNDKNYLKDGLEVMVSIYQGEVLGVILPEKVELKITSTEPAVKGNTTNNAQKDAYVETGLLVRVPLFIEEGETILVNTKDGSYASRA